MLNIVMIKTFKNDLESEALNEYYKGINFASQLIKLVNFYKKNV